MYALLKKYLPKLLWMGFAAEIVVLLAAYWQSNQNVNFALRIATRLSGRLSLIYFALYIIHSLYQQLLEKNSTSLHEKWVLSRNFMVVHIIHLGILLSAIYCNNMELPLLRLLPGITTYIIIILTPFVYRGYIFPKLPLRIMEQVFVAATGLLFLLTYIARLSGKAPFATGSQPSYIIFGVGTAILMLCFVLRKHIVPQNRQG
jgi:hypothetical protein